MSPCETSTFTILTMTREMREAIPGSRSSRGAANAGVERATSSKTTETVLFDMIPPDVFAGILRLRMRQTQVALRNEPPHDPGDDARNARGDSRIAVVARSCEGGRGEGNQQQGHGDGSLRHDFLQCFPGFSPPPASARWATDVASSCRFAERGPSRFWR